MVGLDIGGSGSRFARAAFTPEQSGNWGNVYVDPKAAAATLKLTTSSQPPSASDRTVSGKNRLRAFNNAKFQRAPKSPATPLRRNRRQTRIKAPRVATQYKAAKAATGVQSLSGSLGSQPSTNIKEDYTPNLGVPTARKMLRRTIIFIGRLQ